MARILPPLRTLPGWTAVALGATALAPGAGAAEMNRPVARGVIAPHRDGNVAVAEELEAARHKGTVEAYDLFLARHPDHRLSRVARREREAMLNRHRRR